MQTHNVKNEVERKVDFDCSAISIYLSRDVSRDHYHGLRFMLVQSRRWELVESKIVATIS